jgi:hypothetical protein
MGAVTIHLPVDVEEKVRRASEASGVSVSAWMSEAAKKQLEERLPPPEVTRLFGSVPDFELPTRSEPWSKDEA